ncbi:MAG: AAA family ATPase [Saprospiraceae bacterium]
MDLAYLFGILKRRKWLIVSAMALAAVMTFLFISSKPELYKSNVIIATGIVNYKGINSDNSDAFVQQYQVENAFLNLIEFAQSRSTLKFLTIELLRHDFDAEAGKTGDKPFRTGNKALSNYSEEEKQQVYDEIGQINLDSLSDFNFSPQLDFSLDKIARAYGYDNDALLRGMSVKRKTSTDYLDISFSTESPSLSQFMANAYGQRLLAYYYNLSVREKRKNVESFQKLSAEKKAVVDSINDVRFEYLRQKGLPALGRQSEELVSQISRLELDRQRAQAKKNAAAESVDRIKKYERDNESRNARENKNRLLERNNTVEQMEKVRELKRQSMEAGGKDPEIEAALAEANADLEESLRTSVRSQGRTEDTELKKTKEDLYKERVSVDLDRIDAEESYSRLNNEIYALKNKLSSMVVNDEVSSRMLEALNRAMYEFEKVDNELIKAKLTLENVENPLSIVQGALLPEWPEPNRKVLLSIFSSIVVGTLFVIVLFILAYLDSSLQSPDLFRKYTNNLPLIGTLPIIDVQGFRPEQIFANTDDAFSSFRESLRKIRGQILRSKAKVFLVSGAKKKEGKTLFCLSMAYSLAHNNKKVLVLDTNFKSPLPESYVDRPSVGSDEVNKLVKKHKLEEVFHLKPKADNTNDLDIVDVLGNTGLSQSPSELLDNESFKALLEDFKHQYDIILMEAAAINEYSDAQELEPYAEKVIAVFNANSTIGNVDQDALDHLRDLKDKFAGAVLTEVNPQKIM